MAVQVKLGYQKEEIIRALQNTNCFDIQRIKIENAEDVIGIINSLILSLGLQKFIDIKETEALKEKSSWAITLKASLTREIYFPGGIRKFQEHMQRAK